MEICTIWCDKCKEMITYDCLPEVVDTIINSHLVSKPEDTRNDIQVKTYTEV